MRQAKPGVVFVAAIVALMGIGIGYASWRDELTITGTVTTGTVDIDIVGYSETYVYKTPGHGIAVVHQFYDLPGGPDVGDWYYVNESGQYEGPFKGEYTPPQGSILVASAEVTDINHDTNTVTVEYDNLFPCICFGIDLLLHYAGSIPARVKLADFFTDDQWLQDLVDNGHAGDEAYFVDVTQSPPKLGDPVDIGTQVHKCDYVGLALWIHLPQDDTLQGLSGSATYKVKVIQWNEYEG